MRRASVFLAVAVLAACTSGDGSDDAGRTGRPERLGTGDGWMAEDDWQARTGDYLRFATADLEPGYPLSVMAHAERARRDPDFSWDRDAVTVGALRPIFDKLESFADTSDFDICNLLALRLGYPDDLSGEVKSEIDRQLLAFKYWQDEPTPDRIPVDDHYYWTENHQVIFLADEYVAGQTFPDRRFSNSGMTGEEHMAHARRLLDHWIDLRVRFGFSEWYSNVYATEDIKGLMLLVEHAEDRELATRAAMVVDVVLAEMAGHLQAGSFGATHGRSYMKDKSTAFDEDTYNLAKMLFDDTRYPYQGVDDAMFLAVARRYRLPEAIRRLAVTDEVGVDRSRMGIPVDPMAEITDDPEAPDGLGFSNSDEDKMTWFGAGALTTWQMLPSTLDHLERYDLWKSEVYAEFGELKSIVDALPVPALQELARTLSPQLGLILLPQVNTETWRSPEVMLSSAQDVRPGLRSQQGHAWQATLDANAEVFTTHPANPPREGDEWVDGDGYWTGTASMPRTAQRGQAAIHIYAPQYPAGGAPPLDAFDYEPETHAFFPQEHFDEVVQRGHWTIGRKGDGYVALWSWRATRWREHDPAKVPTGRLKGTFDLVAEGGPDNVWIVEVGRAADQAGGGDPFAAFVDSVTSAPLQVTSRAGGRPDQPAADFDAVKAGFDVRYRSPAEGELVFGWTGPLTVDGAPVDLHPEARWDSPWTTAAWGRGRYAVEVESAVLELDFDAGRRRATR